MVLHSGCYYAHLARGQARLLLARQDIDAALTDPATPPELRDRLRLVKQVRTFAIAQGLRVGGQYTSYAPWPGDRVVTSVVATRPGSVEAAPFRFPIVGEVPYKGFFDSAQAEREGERLRGEGYDVCLVPVAAYSTLGWFDDPVTTPLLRRQPGELVETLLHELVHATVFVAGAARFNEGVATFVGQETTLRFFAEQDGAESPALARVRTRIAEARAIAEVQGRLRNAVAALYQDEDGIDRDARRAALESGARAELAQLSLTGRDSEQIARQIRLGDACLALVGTYHADLPAYREKLRALQGDLGAFLEAVLDAADEPDPRAALLEAR